MTEVERGVLGYVEDLTQPKEESSEHLTADCPACGKRGYIQGWYAQGISSLVEFLCYDTACPRARVPFYVFQLRKTPTPNSCPVCGKVYLTVFTANCCPHIYIHRVKRRNALGNGLLEVTEACRLEIHAQAVGVGS